MRSQRKTYRLGRLGSQRGMAYLIALYITGIIGVYTLVGMSQSVSDIKMAEILTDVNQSFHMAESGAVEAVIEFTTGGDDSSVNFSLAEDWSQNGDATTACVFGQNCQKTLTLASSTAAVTVDDIGAMEPTITSSVNVAAMNFTQTVEVVIERPNASPFNWAVFGEDSLAIGAGVNVDSYNSSLGEYNESLDPEDSVYGDTNRSEEDNPDGWNADLRTNSTLQDTLTASSGTSVFGDAIVGTGGVPSVVIDAPVGVIEGDQEAASTNFVLDPVTLPSGSPSGSPYTVSGDTSLTMSSCNCSSITVEKNVTLTLTGSGALHLDSLTLAKDSDIVIPGNNVTLVTGTVATGPGAELTASGSNLVIYGTGAGPINFGPSSVTNTSQNPANLQLIVDGTQPVTIGSSGDFFGAIYAPDAAVTIGSGADFYGSIVGESISLGANSNMHYDEALKEIKFGGSVEAAAVRSWRQP